MVKILFDNSYSRIVGLSDKDFKALRKELSYKHEGAQFMPNPSSHVAYCIDKKGVFASGLLARVTAFLEKAGLKYSRSGVSPAFPPAQIPRSFTAPYLPYEDQLAAVDATTKTNRGVISAPTGTGKSFIITLLLARHCLRTLIVVPTVELKNQLTETLTAALTTMEGVTVLNIDSPKLKTAANFDMLIIDEVHHAAASTYRKLNKTAWGDIRWRYSLSATPFRNNTEEQLLYEGVAGPVIYTLSYQKAVASGYIVPVEAFYYELPKVAVEGYTYREVYSELVVENQARNELISEILVNLSSAGKYCLCLVKEIKHGKILSDMTGIPFVNGADDDTRRYIQDFNSGRIKVLIGTTGVIGEGVDTKPCEFVVVAGLGKAKSSFMQAVGRSVRRFGDKISAKVILFKDASHKWTTKHFREQVKIIRDEYGTEVLKLD